ncbi:hypothetical protein [Acinetobacter nosocomialis]|uniref:hypothetical protein n=1 Tax=Acinetobacter nosocomialis TaxID=106654 RepID=UPI00208E3AF1|nr:hypothetical protein [Acinetobacter nosocomialis]
MFLSDFLRKIYDLLSCYILRVDAAWLLERYSLSRKSLIEHLRVFNKGNEGKHLYDPTEVIPILDNLHLLNIKRGARRKN